MTTRAAGTVARNVEQCWVWRNVVVAETDAEAERIAIPAFEATHPKIKIRQITSLGELYPGTERFRCEFRAESRE